MTGLSEAHDLAFIISCNPHHSHKEEVKPACLTTVLYLPSHRTLGSLGWRGPQVCPQL